MTDDWTMLQTLFFIITPFIFVLAVTQIDDEDDGPGGGLMQPVYNP